MTEADINRNKIETLRDNIQDDFWAHLLYFRPPRPADEGISSAQRPLALAFTHDFKDEEESLFSATCDQVGSALRMRISLSLVSRCQNR